MTGPYHYKRAEEILAEIEAANAVSNATETALASQAQAHAILALAAATAIDPGCQRHEWHDVAGVGYTEPRDRTIGPAAAHMSAEAHGASEGGHNALRACGTSSSAGDQRVWRHDL
jgi:hypothetical protein